MSKFLTRHKVTYDSSQCGFYGTERKTDDGSTVYHATISAVPDEKLGYSVYPSIYHECTVSPAEVFTIRASYNSQNRKFKMGSGQVNVEQTSGYVDDLEYIQLIVQAADVAVGMPVNFKIGRTKEDNDHNLKLNSCTMKG